MESCLQIPNCPKRDTNEWCQKAPSDFIKRWLSKLYYCAGSPPQPFRSPVYQSGRIGKGEQNNSSNARIARVITKAGSMSNRFHSLGEVSPCNFCLCGPKADGTSWVQEWRGGLSEQTRRTELEEREEPSTLSPHASISNLGWKYFHWEMRWEFSTRESNFFLCFLWFICFNNGKLSESFGIDTSFW